MNSRATEKLATTIVLEQRPTPSIPLAELKAVSRDELPFKVGNLFYEYLANTYLPVLGYRAVDVADYLEAAGLIEVRMIDGQLYYKWTRDKLSRQAFLKSVLPAPAE